MDSSSLVMLGIVIFCIIMSAYFSATETAFSCLNRIRIKNMAIHGDKRARLVMSLLENYDRLLSTILVGNNIVNILSASLATILFTNALGAGGAGVSTAVMTVVVLIFGEISPKSLAREMPEECAFISAPLLRIFMVVLTPVNAVFSAWKRMLAKIFKVKRDRTFSEEELITMIDEAEHDGDLDAHEGELIRSAIEFNDSGVRDVLTPRVDILAVEDTATAEEVADTFRSCGFSRLPVYHEDLDDIIGIIHEKDFYSEVYRKKNTIDHIIKPAAFATTSMKISHLMRLLQSTKTHIAVVVDEFGGTAGIVTLEDIIEELVGDIWDEHDEVVENFQQIGEDTFLISCSAKIDDMFEYLHLNETYDSTTTVNGWVIRETGDIPDVGTKFTYGRLDVEVIKADERRVLEIKVILLPPKESEDEAEDSRW